MPSTLFSIWFKLLSPFFTASLPFFSHNWENENFCVKWGLSEDHFSSLVLMRTKSSIEDLSARTGCVRSALREDSWVHDSQKSLSMCSGVEHKRQVQGQCHHQISKLVSFSRAAAIRGQGPKSGEGECWECDNWHRQTHRWDQARLCGGQRHTHNICVRHTF